MNPLTLFELPGCFLVGRSFRQKLAGPNTAPQEWQAARADGTLDYLGALDGPIFEGAYVGWMGAFDPAAKEFSYCLGVLVREKPSIVDDRHLVIIPLPPCLLAIGTIPSGPQGAHAKNKAIYEQAGYTLDFAKGFEMELYKGYKETDLFRYCSPVTRKP